MSYVPDQAGASPSIPVEPAAPSESAPIHHAPPSASLPSTQLLPLPYDPAQPALAGTAEHPVYFYNATLPVEGHIACSTTFRNVTTLCCPGEIGIWDEGEGGASCRMEDAQQNRDWISNCTHQLWVEHNAGDHIMARKAAVRCWPMEDKLREREKDRKEVLRVSVEGRLGCGTLGTFDEKHNFTGECCDQLGGLAEQIQQSEDGRTWPQACTLSPDQEEQWLQCIQGLGTYGTCTTAYRPPVNLASGAEAAGFGAAVLAAAVGLAALT